MVSMVFDASTTDVQQFSNERPIGFKQMAEVIETGKKHVEAMKLHVKCFLVKYLKEQM